MATTTDGVVLTEGLRVWTNDVERGTVTLHRSWVEGNETWFDVIRDAGGRVLQSESRVATRHPFTGERA